MQIDQGGSSTRQPVPHLGVFLHDSHVRVKHRPVEALFDQFCCLLLKQRYAQTAKLRDGRSHRVDQPGEIASGDVGITALVSVIRGLDIQIIGHEEFSLINT
jgi:hypothetical protein